MSVRVKFKCTSVTKQAGWGGHEFLYSSKLTPVTSGSEENAAFYAATPAGEMSIATVKHDHFEVGREYYIDFTPCS
jgi:hypothetical protein